MTGSTKPPILPVLILLMALFAFEIFNFATTESALLNIFGPGKFLTLSIATWFALGACFVDVGGLYRMFTAETKMKNESREVKMIFVSWLFAAIINAGLTFWVVALSMEQFNGPVPSILRGQEVWIAVSIAAFVFLIRFGLISTLGHVGEKFSLPNFKLRKGSNRFFGSRGGNKQSTPSAGLTGLNVPIYPEPKK